MDKFLHHVGIGDESLPHKSKLKSGRNSDGLRDNPGTRKSVGFLIEEIQFLLVSENLQRYIFSIDIFHQLMEVVGIQIIGGTYIESGY